ncbi:MAG: FxsA family protein [Natrialbaceae archaeon]|nr:FxsA family protein [Natrialbaceae archaeon]
MLRWIALLLLIPFLDAVLLAVVVSQTPLIGWVGMILLVVLTGLVGLLLVRAEGRRTLRKIQRSLQQGDPPTDQLLDAGLLIAAGAFLLTPGLVTDLIGFLIVIPVTRYPIRVLLKRYVLVPYVDDRTGGFASGRIYTVGFPDPSQESAGGTEHTYDLSGENYSVETDDEGTEESTDR